MLDTNVLLSACMKPAGLEARVMEMAVSGRIELFVSAAVEAEYRDVLFRAKFAPFHARAESILDELAARWTLVTPAEQVSDAFDEDDNRFLECAAEADAQFLITGNLRHYPAEWRTLNILNARSFLTRIEAE